VGGSFPCRIISHKIDRASVEESIPPSASGLEYCGPIIPPPHNFFSHPNPNPLPIPRTQFGALDSRFFTSLKFSVPYVRISLSPHGVHLLHPHFFFSFPILPLQSLLAPDGEDFSQTESQSNVIPPRVDTAFDNLGP